MCVCKIVNQKYCIYVGTDNLLNIYFYLTLFEFAYVRNLFCNITV